MKPRVLMVAFEFPPCNGASVQRILSVYQGFVEQGYEVDVLTAKAHAYVKTSEDLLALIPTDHHENIQRTLALDAMRHLAIKGKHIAISAVPDRWALTWVPSATRAGKKMVKDNAYDIIWSSAPMGSVHFIASRLVRWHREHHDAAVTWIADYRDPLPYMHNEGREPKTRKEIVDHSFDQAVLEHADMITAATPGILELYRSRYPEAMSRLPQYVMKNGYMASFMEAQREWLKTHPEGTGLFSGKGKHLYYAGVLYTDGRDPGPIFEALAAVNAEVETPIILHFQASGDGSEYQEQLDALGMDRRTVRFHEGVSLTEAVRNMLCADGLLLIQDEKFNRQIPGKLYEYLATNRPVLIKSPAESLATQEAKAFDAVWQGYSVDALTEMLFKWHAHNTETVRDASAFSRENSVRAMIENIQQPCAGHAATSKESTP